MKLAKMSMVAALLLGANAYAIDNVKVSGDAKLYYQTVDTDTAGAKDMFDKSQSAGDAALSLGVTADLTEGVSAGATFNAVSSLGLENNLVDNTWSGAHDATVNGGADLGVQVDDASWFSEAWIAGTAGKTTAKVGRMALDTPLLFTETWGISQNTFEGAVVINQDLPDTTLVAGYVGKSNGSATDVNPRTLGLDLGMGIVANGGTFNSFHNGAYAYGVVNNSWKPLTAQAWYYDVSSLATAYWLQADIECSLVEGVMIGAQYTGTDWADSTPGGDAFAVMLGYAMKDVVTVKAAYSSVDDKDATVASNLATSASQTKMYTEMWWNYGQVATMGADSFSVTAEGTAAGVDLLLGFYSSEQDTASVNDIEVTEIAFTAGKSFGPLDATLALINDDISNETATANDHTDTTLQVYLTYNF